MGKPRVLGLVAGSGLLPLHFARRARAQGFDLVTAAIRGSAPKALDPLSREIRWITSGQLGALLSFFKMNGVARAVMLGKVEHSGSFRDLRLDWKALAVWAKLKDRSGEGLLRAVAGELSKNGTRVLDSRTLLEDLLVGKGWAVRGRWDKEAEGDVRYGLGAARSLARKGVGQSLLVKQRAVVAAEGMEGTDEAVLRAGKLAGPGLVLVKVASPKQDWRFDVPTVGPKTLQVLAKVRAKGLVLEAGKAFLLERERTLSVARKAGIFVKGV